MIFTGHVIKQPYCDHCVVYHLFIYRLLIVEKWAKYTLRNGTEQLQGHTMGNKYKIIIFVLDHCLGNISAYYRLQVYPLEHQTILSCF